MLIKTITMETSDTQLFSKASPLLPAASELTFHTVNCSALNAEELRRENGIEVLDKQKRKITFEIQLIVKIVCWSCVSAQVNILAVLFFSGPA